LRRSELVAIRYEFITWNEQGIDILISHSKTDQTNEGQYCAVPYGNEQLYPIKALKAWLGISEIKSGSLFRHIRKNNEISENHITPLSINLILKKRAQESGIQNAGNLSSHSLRRGLATSASRDGASLAAIMRQGRWKNVNTVMEYVEATQRFEENAANNVLKNLNITK
jgi:integrase